MPQKTVGSAFEFAIEALRENPELDFRAVKERAAKVGLDLQPILYGRARVKLGLPGKAQTPPPPPPPAPRVPPPPPIVPGVPDRHATRAQAREPLASTMPAARTPALHDPQADIVMPKKQGSPAFEFAVQILRSQPAIPYQDLKSQAEAKGFKLPPILYGRAKAFLGLVPVKPRGAKKAKAPVPTLGAPLQLRQVESVAADQFAKKLDEVRSLEQVVAVVKELEAERRRLRNVLESLLNTIDDALGA